MKSFISGIESTSKKFVLIPGLELTAVVLSVTERVTNSCVKERFWTDIEKVLAYIRNNSKRFRMFVANRVNQIQQNTNVEQWSYVSSKKNPADDAW